MTRYAGAGLFYAELELSAPREVRSFPGTGALQCDRENGTVQHKPPHEGMSRDIVLPTLAADHENKWTLFAFKNGQFQAAGIFVFARGFVITEPNRLLG